MIKVTKHPDLITEEGLNELPEIIEVAFLAEGDLAAVPCFSTDQLNISLLELNSGRIFGALSMRYGDTGLVVGHTDKQKIQNIINALQRLKEIMP